MQNMQNVFVRLERESTRTLRILNSPKKPSASILVGKGHVWRLHSTLAIFGVRFFIQSMLITYYTFVDEIEKEFIFFPTLHRIFASRPNVTPIVITTGVGPNGPKTVWIQPPGDNSNIDPILLNEDRLRMAASQSSQVSQPSQASQPSQPRERSFGDNMANLRESISCFLCNLFINQSDQ